MLLRKFVKFWLKRVPVERKKKKKLNQNPPMNIRNLPSLWKGIQSFHNIFVTKCFRPQIFQIMNSIILNNQSLKYQRFTRSDCKDIGLRRLEFVTKTQFLWTTI